MKIIALILALGLGLALILMPLWTAIIARLIFKKANPKTLAQITALPFSALLISRRELWPDLDWGEQEPIVEIMMIISILFAMFIVNFGIPFLLAKGGVGIGDLILNRKNPNQRVELTR